jgi:hypothetical protein
MARTAPSATQGVAMKHFLRNNGLSLAALALFFFSLIGQSVAGMAYYNEEQQEHGGEAVSYVEYLTSGHFGESVFENWESEFLQMGMFVLLTVWLRQKGSPESKKIDEPEVVDREPGTADVRKAPWPVRHGGLVQTVYSHSLSAALLTLFVASFLLHAWTGAIEFSEEQLEHGGQAVTMLGYMGNSRFWFESLQNWQSEFLAIFSLVVLGIFLREQGSHESKPVDAPISQTGEDGGPKPGEYEEGSRVMPKAA